LNVSQVLVSPSTSVRDTRPQLRSYCDDHAALVGGWHTRLRSQLFRDRNGWSLSRQ